MRSIRRIYFYLVAFISALTMVWGVTNLLRSVANQQIVGSQSSILSAGLAQVLVSIPIFLLHWLVVQKDAKKSDEEKNSLIRAVFLYAILLSSLIPAIQNLIAMLNRLLLRGVGLNPERALVGGLQTIPDNLIAILVNLILAAYFFTVLRNDWATSTDDANLVDVRRLYRYIWMLYSLALTILGTQKVISFILIWQNSIGSTNKEQLINALILLLIGTPLWIYWWTEIQRSVLDPAERQSTLRIIVLYLLALIGAVTALVNIGVIVYWILKITMGNETLSSLITNLSSPLSLALTFGVVWSYFSKHLHAEIRLESDLPRQSALLRIYRYILAAGGLGGTIIGMIGVIGYVIDLTTSDIISSANTLAPLEENLSVLLVGVVVWLFYWLKVNSESFLMTEEGEHARRSLTRKTFLYVVVFSCVIGTMAAAGFLIYTLLQSAFGITNQKLLQEALSFIRLIVVFSAFLAYHLTLLRRDGKTSTISLTEKQAAFPVTIVTDQDSEIGAGLVRAFERYANGIPYRFTGSKEIAVDDLPVGGVIIITSDKLISCDEKLHKVIAANTGKLVVLPVKTEQTIWLVSPHKPWDIYRGCVQTVKALAEGQSPKPISGSSAWLVVAYIVGGLFGLQILLTLVGLLFGGRF